MVLHWAVLIAILVCMFHIGYRLCMLVEHDITSQEIWLYSMHTLLYTRRCVHHHVYENQLSVLTYDRGTMGTALPLSALVSKHCLTFGDTWRVVWEQLGEGLDKTLSEFCTLRLHCCIFSFVLHLFNVIICVHT